MNIAFLNAYGNGSTGRIVGELMKLCENAGYQVLSIYARGACARQDESVFKCHNIVGFYTDGFFSRLVDNHGLNNRLNTRGIINKLREFKPDIIHIHNLHGYWVNYPMLFKYIKECGAKVVWTFHDCWHITGHCTHFDFIKCEKWKSGCHDCEQLKEYPASFGYDGSKRNYAMKKKFFTSLDKMVIVTPSNWLKAKVKDSFFNKYDIRVINNGVDVDVFKPSDIINLRKEILDSGFDKIVLGVAATWNERKGLKDILEVANQESKWFFIIIGSIAGDKPTNTELQNVLYIDRTENVQTLCDWYSAADVFVNPTLEDTYPTTNLESIACGTPVVTYATGGSEEIVRQSGFGEVTKERTPKALHKSIINVFSVIPELKEDFNLNSKDKFTEYLQLYNSLK